MHTTIRLLTVNIPFAGVRLVDLRGVCDRFLFGVRVELTTVFFRSSTHVCLVFLSGVLMRVLATARLRGVHRRGDVHVFEADTRHGDGFSFNDTPLLRGLANDCVSVLCEDDEVAEPTTELDGKQMTCFLYGDITDFLRHCKSFLSSSSLSAAELQFDRKKAQVVNKTKFCK